MRIVFKFFSILCIALALSNCKNNVDTEKIKFGVDASTLPYSYLENNELKGFLIDIDKEIAAKLKRLPEFHIMQWNDMIAALNNNIIDCASGMTETAEKKKNVDFSTQYIFDYIAVIFKTDNNFQRKTDLDNKKVAITLGGAPEIFTRKYLENTHIIPSNNNPLSMELLKSGHIDAIITEVQAAIIFCKKNDGYSYKIIERVSDGAGFAMKKNSPLLPKINKALEELIDEGTVDELYKKWFNNIDLGEENILK
jgi:ABC-type amino acid transport substrate-binding protein